MRYLLLAVVLFLVSSATSAHPDRSAGAPVGLLHDLADPFHFAVTAAGVFVLAFGWGANVPPAELMQL